MGVLIRFGFEKSQYGGLDDPEKSLGPLWKKRIFDAVLATAVMSVHPNGLPPMMTRQYNRILNAMDLSADDTIEIDQADAEFLASILKDDKTRVPPAQVRVFCLLQDEINRVLQG